MKDKYKSLKKALLKGRERLIKEHHFLRDPDKRMDQRSSLGELSGYDNHPAEVATETFEREMNVSLDRYIMDLIDMIDSALLKLEEETFGSCERCGKEISLARLEVIPYAQYCIECEELVEKNKL